MNYIMYEIIFLSVNKLHCKWDSLRNENVNFSTI